MDGFMWANVYDIANNKNNSNKTQKQWLITNTVNLFNGSMAYNHRIIIYFNYNLYIQMCVLCALDLLGSITYYVAISILPCFTIIIIIISFLLQKHIFHMIIIKYVCVTKSSYIEMYQNKLKLLWNQINDIQLKC